MTLISHMALLGDPYLAIKMLLSQWYEHKWRSYFHNNVTCLLLTAAYSFSLGVGRAWAYLGLTQIKPRGNFESSPQLLKYFGFIGIMISTWYYHQSSLLILWTWKELYAKKLKTTLIPTSETSYKPLVHTITETTASFCDEGH